MRGLSRKIIATKISDILCIYESHKEEQAMLQLLKGKLMTHLGGHILLSNVHVTGLSACQGRDITPRFWP
jgi:hypothetical protein